MLFSDAHVFEEPVRQLMEMVHIAPVQFGQGILISCTGIGGHRYAVFLVEIFAADRVALSFHLGGDIHKGLDQR